MLLFMEAVSKNLLKIKVLLYKPWRLNLELKSAVSADACVRLGKLFHN